MRYGISTVAVFLVVFGAACGGNQTRDRPDDCTEDEFYNEQTKRCTPCPALQPPDCPEGCGWEVYELDNGCEAARCAENCEYCGEGEYFSEEAAVCKGCPGTPDCSRFECEGELQVEGRYRAPCPDASAYACGGCEHPEEGCEAADDGSCRDLPE